MKFIESCIIIYFCCNLQFVHSQYCFDDFICIPSEYNKFIKPAPKNETTDVFVQFKGIQVINIDENKSTITLKLAILMAWSEPRIFISPNATEEDKKQTYSTDLPKEFANHLWMPDAYIPDMHKIHTYHFINDFEGYFHLMKTSLIGCKIEVETVIFCKMNFTDYPMDENSCYFTLGSYKPLNKSQQRFELYKFPNMAGNPLEFDVMQQIARLDFTICVKELPKHKETIKHIGGIYQRTGFEIKFKRKFNRYIDDYYLPSGILVVLSWVSKYMHILFCHYYHVFLICD